MTFPVLRTGESDPLVLRVLLALRCALYLWLTYFLFQAATTFISYTPGQPWPFLLSMVRMWTFLPIHEAGHLFFGPFGTVVMFLGGSILQVLLPLLWFLLALKQRSDVAPFPLFWAGENLLDVSLYIRDATLRQLPLLGGHRSGHDWFNILSRWDLLASAETIADVTYMCGIMICVAAIAAGITLSVRSYRHPPPMQIEE